MAIPDYQACMLPLLRFASDGKEHQLKDAADQLAKEFGLTAKELQEFLPSGQQPTFINRIGWATRREIGAAELGVNPWGFEAAAD